ncbi:MAG: hydroxymethylglutaryl-CoA reductase [Patulibacter minatonensis]
MSTPKIPRATDDYTLEAAAARRAFVTEQTGASLEHVGTFSVDPATLPGNVEHFTGVAQVPIGIAGPVLVDGEHAQGEFFIPMATSEGTLVASYNRGMKLVRLAGGVKTTVVKESMQRAPVFMFESAREARDFQNWLIAHEDGARTAAQSTTSTGRLVEIEKYLAGRFCFTRFDYTTGDAAGQNMTGKATWAACEWIKANYPGDLDYALEANLATDKKHSQINNLHTRGRRVIAEITIPNALLQEVMNTTSEALYRRRQISGQVGAWLSGSVNNGAHSANGITALFIATGQDVANVSESHAAHAYVELRENGDYYYSITIPSLICATYGGGTGLATQRECLEMMGCYGAGNALKFAEIVAATVVAGELSLGSAIVADEWVSSHDQYGRNR